MADAGTAKGTGTVGKSKDIEQEIRASVIRCLKRSPNRTIFELDAAVRQDVPRCRTRQFRESLRHTLDGMILAGDLLAFPIEVTGYALPE